MRTANNDTAVVDGVIRVRGDEGDSNGQAAATDTVTSYVTMTDLVKLPVHIVDDISQLTFATIDGRLHSFVKTGVSLDVTGG